MYKWIYKLFNIPEKVNPNKLEYQKAKEIADELLICVPSSRGYTLTMYYCYKKVNKEKKGFFKIHYSFKLCEEEETMEVLLGKANITDVISGIDFYLKHFYNCEKTYDKHYLS